MLFFTSQSSATIRSSALPSATRAAPYALRGASLPFFTFSPYFAASIASMKPPALISPKPGPRWMSAGSGGDAIFSSPSNL